MKAWVGLLAFGIGAALLAGATASKPANEYIYVLRLAPRLHNPGAWEPADHAALARHVAYYEAAVKGGVLVLAGRTTEPNDRTFGITIFRAVDDAAARAFVASDPGVAEGIMSADLRPYRIAFGPAAIQPARQEGRP